MPVLLILTIIGHQTLAWALGMAFASVLLDVGPGLMRDHPPMGRRIAGMLIGPLAVVSLGMLYFSGGNLTAVALVAPFALMALWYSWVWLMSDRAERRRELGRQVVILGGIGVLFFMLIAGPSHWAGGMVMAAYTASGALLGGISTILLQFVTARARDVIPGTASPFGIPARMTALGLGIIVLAVPDMLTAMGGAAFALRPLGEWFALSLAVPAALTGLGHRLFPRFQPTIWSLALVSVLVGQAVIHTLLLTVPGFVSGSGL